MPQILLEYSSNLKDLDYGSILEEVHNALSTIGDAKLENCKSRAKSIDSYYIGDGDGNNAFILLEIYLMEGITKTLKKKISKHLLEYMESFIVETWREDLDTQITVHFIDIIKTNYFKKVI